MFLLAVIGLSLLSLTSAQQVVGNVAFTAVVKSHKTVNAGSTIVFESVLNNIGDAYNENTGVFTASKGGIYVLSFSALTQANSRVYVDLFVNDAYQVSAYASSGIGSYDTATNSVTLKLKYNDKVYIKTRKDAYLYGVTNDVYAVFTGYLIGLL